MDMASLLEQLQAKVAELAASTPAADLQKNLKALLGQQFAAWDLVTRDELEATRSVLIAALQRMEALEARLSAKAPE